MLELNYNTKILMLNIVFFLSTLQKIASLVDQHYSSIYLLQSHKIRQKPAIKQKVEGSHINNNKRSLVEFSHSGLYFAQSL